MNHDCVQTLSLVLLFNQNLSPINFIIGFSMKRVAGSIENQRPKEIYSSRRRGLIVVPSLKEINSLVTHHIYNAVLLRYPTGPCTWRQILQWFRFTYSLERITQYVFDKPDCSESGLAILRNPVLQVLNKFRLKDGFPIFTRQGRPRLQVPQSSLSVPHP